MHTDAAGFHGMAGAGKADELNSRKAPPTVRSSKVLDRQVFYKGDTIIEQGTSAGRAFYIESGRVEVTIREGPHRVKIAELGPGEIFGEMALIDHDDRSAAVTAIADTTVTIISASDFEQKIESLRDKAVRALIHVLIRRLKKSNQGQLVQYKNFAEFQDRIAGIVEKAASGIDENKRRQFREEVTPLLEQLDALLESYRRRK